MPKVANKWIGTAWSGKHKTYLPTKSETCASHRREGNSPGATHRKDTYYDPRVRALRFSPISSRLHQLIVGSSNGY